ncbi:hypothetical protein IEO70_04660 [Bacillus sp. AGMB 02131]|uniref:DUF2802 domain-containing protein n=1 Tax=Peribacillus faecalis TaxID=2772559 RepID=A0A927CX99_9BACI|nr:hypothetical protein [Peribacillus faecalis]MBD3107650.1 hypothetical protein [Peribacillus faecalis]
MEIVIISLLVLAILLFILSFFKIDRVSELERNVEEMSLQHIQDIYQLKRQVRILEEELLTPEHSSIPSDFQENTTRISEILKNQVKSLYQQGFSIDEISARSTLSHDDIMQILQNS